MAGAASAYSLEVPPEILKPGANHNGEEQQVTVELRPLTIGHFQLISRAAREDPGLVPILMISEALVSPKLTPGQVKGMHMGLVEFLIEHIRRISGLSEKKNTWSN